MNEQEHLESAAKDLGNIIADVLPPRVGFMLLLFEMDGDWTTYISNAQRDDMLKALEELTEKLRNERRTG